MLMSVFLLTRKSYHQVFKQRQQRPCPISLMTASQCVLLTVLLLRFGVACAFAEMPETLDASLAPSPSLHELLQRAKTKNTPLSTATAKKRRASHSRSNALNQPPNTPSETKLPNAPTDLGMPTPSTEALPSVDVSPLVEMPVVNAPQNKSVPPATGEGALSSVSLIAPKRLNDTGNVNQPLGLQQVIDTVLVQNYDIRLAQSRLDESKAIRLRAIAEFLPSVTGDVSFEKYDGGTIFVRETPVDVVRDTWYPKLIFDLPIALGGGPVFQLRSANYRILSSRFDIDSTQQEQLYRALESYFTAQAELGRIEAAKQAVAEAKASVALQSSRMKTGVGKRLDLLQAQSLEATQAVTLATIKTSYTTALANLQTVLALPVTGELTLQQEAIKPYQWLDDTVNLTESLAKAKQNRPNIKALEAQLKEAQMDLNTLKASYIPTLNLGSYVGGVGPDLDGLTGVKQAGIRVRVDVLNSLGVDNWGRIKAQKAKLEQQAITLQKALNEAEREVVEAFWQTKNLRDKAALLDAKLVASKEAYRLAVLRQNTQVGIYLEVSQTLNDYVSAQAEYTKTVMELNAAQVRLLYETGDLKPSLLTGLAFTATGSVAGNTATPQSP
jgi:outer membrane protein TolC